MNFEEENESDWIDIQNKIFPLGVPVRCEWTDLQAIVSVLKTIGSIESSNHMFFPTGGGLDIEDANFSVEEGCIEVDTGGLIEILKPKNLIFHSFNSKSEWNYFRIETYELQPSGVYNDTNLSEDYSDEEVAEVQPGNYISMNFWDEGEYEGKKIPENARVVTRHFRGAFVIFQKTSTYNRNSRTYDGRHNRMNDEEFRLYIQQTISNLKSEKWDE